MKFVWKLHKNSKPVWIVNFFPYECMSRWRSSGLLWLYQWWHHVNSSEPYPWEK